MKVFHQLAEFPQDFGPTLVSVGNFDGVHRAHAHVLRNIVERAKTQDAKAVAVTFDPHPVRILRPDSGLKLLTRLLRSCGCWRRPESTQCFCFLSEETFL